MPYLFMTFVDFLNRFLLLLCQWTLICLPRQFIKIFLQNNHKKPFRKCQTDKKKINQKANNLTAKCHIDGSLILEQHRGSAFPIHDAMQPEICAGRIKFQTTHLQQISGLTHVLLVKELSPRTKEGPASFHSNNHHGF